jgi:hypothetical protein
MAFSSPTIFAQTAAAQVNISVSMKDAVPISPLLYGINYDWDKITASEFPAFSAAMSDVAHVSMVRSPSGWNAEVYDWDTNTETGRRAPAQPGAKADAVLAAFPVRTFISPSQNAIADPSQIGATAEQSARLVRMYGSQVRYWEIGNEWWLQKGAKEDKEKRAYNLREYAALIDVAVSAMKKANPSIQIFVGGEWTKPDDFSTLRRLTGAAIWKQITGIYVHPYCGTTDPQTLCSSLPERLAAVRAASGKQVIYASEWAVARKLSTDDYGIRNAIFTVSALRDLAFARVQLAAYWPPVKVLPALAFTSADFQKPFPTGVVFGWMSKWYEGKALHTAGDPLAVAATRGGEVTVIVPTADAGPQTVTIRLVGVGIHRIVSAEVLYADDPDNLQASARNHVVDLPAAVMDDKDGGRSVRFTLDPGTPGRGKAFEVARVTLR